MSIQSALYLEKGLLLSTEEIWEDIRSAEQLEEFRLELLKISGTSNIVFSLLGINDMEIKDRELVGALNLMRSAAGLIGRLAVCIRKITFGEVDDLDDILPRGVHYDKTSNSFTKSSLVITEDEVVSLYINEIETKLNDANQRINSCWEQFPNMNDI